MGPAQVEAVEARSPAAPGNSLMDNVARTASFWGQASSGGAVFCMSVRGRTRASETWEAAACTGTSPAPAL